MTAVRCFTSNGPGMVAVWECSTVISGETDAIVGEELCGQLLGVWQHLARRVSRRVGQSSQSVGAVFVRCAMSRGRLHAESLAAQVRGGRAISVTRDRQSFTCRVTSPALLAACTPYMGRETRRTSRRGASLVNNACRTALEVLLTATLPVAARRGSLLDSKFDRAQAGFWWEHCVNTA